MAKNKIYDFLPGHLKNSELQTIFEGTLERAFSKGSVEKTRAYIGRKEKGINRENDIYLTFPPHAFNRENYGLEPVYASTYDKVFYEDMLNALFNKGALTNDHRRLFDTKKKTINIPIHLDKFINFEMYYWIKPGFDTSITGSTKKHYVTIGRDQLNIWAVDNWWANENQWYHYDDIKNLITENNSEFMEQAKRPIIEFDSRLELSNDSLAKVAGTNWECPTFKIYDKDGEVTDINAKIFSYVLGDDTLYNADQELGFTPLMVAGDYISEFQFNIDMADDQQFDVDGQVQPIYIDTVFPYRNFRQEFGREAGTSLTLSQAPQSENAIDVYIDGIKLQRLNPNTNNPTNYTVDVTTNIITLNNAPEGFVYVDYCTNSPVVNDGDTGFQRLHHSLEFNVDNKTYTNTNLSYSLVYEHFLRIVETTPGLTGDANGFNNFRKLTATGITTTFNNRGSVLVTNSVDVKDAFFALTRDDYDPIKAVEFLSTTYQGYKNKLVTTIREILDGAGSTSKSDLLILEEALNNISLSKRDSISIFDKLDMINNGEIFSHFQEAEITITPNAKEQTVPSEILPFGEDRSVSVFKDNVLQRLDVDYTISDSGKEITFKEDIPSTSTIIVRRYDSIKEAYIPPSATYLKLNPAYKPEMVVDENYSSNVNFLRGHDGSLMASYGDRTDSIMLMFETFIWNNLDKNIERTTLDYVNYGVYQSANSGEWSNSEKNYTMYPFFKKWMIRNNIDDLKNTTFDVSDWKSWNYRNYDATSPGNWRGIFEFAYNTDNPLEEPWKVAGLSQEPNYTVNAGNFVVGKEYQILTRGSLATETDFTTIGASANSVGTTFTATGAGTGTGTAQITFRERFGSDFTDPSFWNNLFIYYNISNIPVPVGSNNQLRDINSLFFNSQIGNNDIGRLSEDWEFGDGSPVEMAWRRSSEYPFAQFILMTLTKPFKILHTYKDEVNRAIEINNSREGHNTSQILLQKREYEFKLGSKLGCFVNNFRLFAENTSMSNSKYTEIPKDNYELVIHSGEPNRSEFFSAIVIEKVSMDSAHPIYALGNTASYKPGDIVYNESDKKYYKRKLDGQTTAEFTGAINFDYQAWVMISQPKTQSFGYRVQGYDEVNPTFFAMDWDRSSGEKAFSTKGDRMNLNEWQEGYFYRQDSYMKYQGQAYVCLREHTSTTLLDDNIEDWKQLVEWPTTNVITAYGYKEFQNDAIKSFNYGDIVTSIDDVAHLMVGYQKYLELIGWGLTDIDEQGNTINYEQLLLKFLEWSSETHEPGDFITLSPMLLSGNFTAPYGVATVRKETHKNFYRVVDASGRLIPNTSINFTTDGKTINFRSDVPIYGMKIDIKDVEHAFVVDRVDSYNDVIYDPHNHNRNLRMQIDCNRNIDWDGTLTVDGYLTYGDELIPNFETIAEESKYYRDTLIDQSLDSTNTLKGSQIGYSKRAYLSNHGIERESSLEFYKGFLSHKGTESAINRIINNNSNYKDVTHQDVWAVKINEYGKLNNGYKVSQDVNTIEILSDPHTISYNNLPQPFVFREIPKYYPVKTTGYVDGSDVNHTVKTEYDLVNLNNETLYEGDTAWIQFDPNREWDVRRLSEVAEIAYVGETDDNQLYIGLTNEIDTVETVYLKIKNSTIDPEVADYYYLVSNGTKTVDGILIYEYLVFELNYEPLIVEIDSSTSNSLFVPTSSQQGVEAIGSVSNPVISAGDSLVIDGTTFSYVPGSGTSSSGINIGGESATVDPVVSLNERMQMIVYGSNGTIENSNTLVTFRGTTATATSGLTSQKDDEVTINGTTLTVDFSAVSSISESSTATETTAISAGETVIVDSVTKSFADLTVTGTVLAPTIPQNKPLQINGTLLSLISGDDVDAVITNINTNSIDVVASKTVDDELVLTTSSGVLELSGSALQDLGLSTGTSYRASKFENIATELSTIAGITATVSVGGILTIASSNNTMVLGGTALTTLGMSAGTYNATSEPTSTSVVNQINSIPALSGVTATATGGAISITSSNPTLEIVEVTAGAMSRLGFSSTTVTVDSLTNIKEDIENQALSGVTGVTVTKGTSGRQLQITSTQSSIVLTNVIGNPLNDIGIPVGTYSNAITTSSSATEFKDQINSQSTDVSANITSDGRMVFTTSNVSLTFSGTTEAMLNKLGLYREYTSVTSNANFKAMRWKSMRFTPFFRFEKFDEFYTDLGLNSEALIWADDYDGEGWAILTRNSTGTLLIRNRQANTLEVDYMKRMILRDGENFFNYQLFDPLNLKFPGTAVKDIDYITWEDPAGYDETSSNELWLDENLGKIWWDTSLARYYRYNDYGDLNKNLVEAHVSKYWGKLVPGSEINIKQWSKSQELPEGITTFTTKVYFDTIKNKSITEYFYWSEVGSEPVGNKSLSIAEIKMLIESGDINNKFIPISGNKIIISNNAYVFENEKISATVEYRVTPDIDTKHIDWRFIKEGGDLGAPSSVVDGEILNQLTDSLAGITFQQYDQKLVEQSMLGDPNFASIPFPILSGLYGEGTDDATINNIVATLNSKIIDAKDISFDIDPVNAMNAKLKIASSVTVLVDDVVRVYRVQPVANSWFTNLQSARENFSSLMNKEMSNRFLKGDFPFYKDFIHPDELAMSMKDWYLKDEYKEIKRFGYLSKTRTFDMLKLYREGIKSFKLELPTHNEFYAEHEGVLRLVNRSSSSLNLSYVDVVKPENDVASEQYYENALGVQIHELFSLLRGYPVPYLLNNMIFGMINYLYTEKSHPDWLFKSSYIDIRLFHREFRQYAIYQRDSEEDIVEYINEAKPYHTKIRTKRRHYNQNEVANTNVDIEELHKIKLDFGNHSRYSDDILEGGNENIIDADNYPDIEDGTWEQGRLLRTRYQNTNDEGGFDTGLVLPKFLDSSTVKVKRYTDDTRTTHDKTYMFVYDMFGRGWKIEVKAESTATTFDGTTLVVNTPASFTTASKKNKKLIAFENETTGIIEFMTYNKKASQNLTIDERGLYTGLHISSGTANKIYALDTPLEMTLHGKLKPEWI